MSKRAALRALISRHKSAPAKAYLSLEEATSFLAFGAFLAGNDLATLCRKKHDAPKQWSDASKRILDEAKTGQLTFYGLKARKFGANAKGEPKKIKAIFFAEARELVISPTSILFDKKDPNRTLYYKVMVSKDEFTRAFPDAKLVRGGGSKPRYDWAPFIAEAVKQLHDMGDFTISDPHWTRAKLVSQMASWCLTNWGTEPSEATIKTRVTEARREFLRQKTQDQSSVLN